MKRLKGWTMVVEFVLPDLSLFCMTIDAKVMLALVLMVLQWLVWKIHQGCLWLNWYQKWFWNCCQVEICILRNCYWRHVVNDHIWFYRWYICDKIGQVWLTKINMMALFADVIWIWRSQVCRGFLWRKLKNKYLILSEVLLLEPFL